MCLLLTLLAAACAGDGGEVEEIDLVSLLGVAEIDSSELAGRASGAGRLRRGEGWSHPEERDGEAFAWGLGERSELDFTLDRPRSLRLSATAWAFGYPQAPEQEVVVVVNGERVGRWALDGGWEPRPVAVILPQRATAAGDNRIELLYRYHEQPSRVLNGSTDERPLAVAWKGLRLGPAPPRAGLADGGELSPAAEGSAAAADRALLLPYGSAVSYYLRLPHGGELEVAEVGSLAGAPGRLVAEVAAGDRDRRTESKLRGGRGRGVHLEIPSGSAAPVRLTFRALAAEGGEGGGLRVVSPRLIVPRPAPVFEPPPAVREHRRPNVLVYLVDTLRADHLGCYGYPRRISPHVDRLAATGTRFAHAVGQTSWTRPAVASVLTGLNPRRHGTNGRKDALPPTLPVLPELLRGLGYETAGFSTNGNVSAAFGFDRGFDLFTSLPEEKTPDIHQLSDRLNQAALGWLRERSRERPFALYLHASDPHYPYTPRPEVRRRWAASVPDDPDIGSMRRVQSLRQGQQAPPQLAQWLIELYDAEIAFNDASFGALMQSLGEMGYADSTLVVFLGDHGEEFHEHGGWTHGETLYQEQLAVPLIFRFPDGFGAGRVVDATARQVDVLPTVLDYLGEEPPPGLDGRSLLPWVGGEERGGGRAGDGASALAWLDLDGWQLEAIVEGEWKLIHNLRPRQGIGGSAELYDLAGDPGERSDLAAGRPDWRGYLLASLRAARLGAGPAARAEEAEIDAELESRLRALGYLR